MANSKRQSLSVFYQLRIAEAVLLEQWPEDLSLRFLLTGGDKLHPVSAAFPFSLVNHYGPTENTVVTTCATVVSTTDTSPPIGRPIANTQVYILDYPSPACSYRCSRRNIHRGSWVSTRISQPTGTDE